MAHRATCLCGPRAAVHNTAPPRARSQLPAQRAGAAVAQRAGAADSPHSGAADSNCVSAAAATARAALARASADTTAAARAASTASADARCAIPARSDETVSAEANGEVASGWWWCAGSATIPPVADKPTDDSADASANHCGPVMLLAGWRNGSGPCLAGGASGALAGEATTTRALHRSSPSTRSSVIAPPPSVPAAPAPPPPAPTPPTPPAPPVPPVLG